MTDHLDANPPDPALCPTEFAELGNGVKLSYVCEGVGGSPLTATRKRSGSGGAT
jgi:hypothetical protein